MLSPLNGETVSREGGFCLSTAGGVRRYYFFNFALSKTQKVGITLIFGIFVYTFERANGIQVGR